MGRVWLKLYVDMLNDEKVNKLSDRAFRTFIQLLLLAKEAELESNRGRIEAELTPNRDGMIPLKDHEIRWRLRCGKGPMNKVFDKLVELNLIERTEKGIRIINYAKRQDSPEAIRQRRYRDKHRESNVTSNATVTERSRSRIENREVDLDLKGVIRGSNGMPPSGTFGGARGASIPQTHIPQKVQKCTNINCNKVGTIGVAGRWYCGKHSPDNAGYHTTENPTVTNTDELEEIRQRLLTKANDNEQPTTHILADVDKFLR